MIALLLGLFMSLNFQCVIVPEDILVLDIEGTVVIHRTKSSRIIVSTKVYTNFAPEITKHLKSRWKHDKFIKKGEYIKVTMHRSNKVVVCKGQTLKENFITHVYIPEGIRYYEDNTANPPTPLAIYSK